MKQLPSQYNAATVKNVNVDYLNYANQKAVKKIVDVYTDGSGQGYSSENTYNVGILTGAIAEDMEGNLLVQYIYDNKVYWTTADGIILQGSAETTMLPKAENQLEQLIQNDVAVFQDLLLASEFVARLEAKGYNCAQYMNEIRLLSSRLAKRQNYIITYCNENSIKYNSPNLLSDSLTKIVNGDRIGIAVSTTIILTAVVTGVFASMAWYIFYTAGAESKSDCKRSKELNKILADVDEETKEELYKFIDNYADSYYRKAVARTKAGGLFSNVKNVLLIGATAYVAYKLLKNRKSNEIS